MTEVDGGLKEYLEVIDCIEYAKEFQRCGLLKSHVIETETLVALGNKLKVSNAERNMIYNKVQLYRSRREVRVKLDELQMKSRNATKVAKTRAEMSLSMEKQSTANLYQNYLKRQHSAKMAISESYDEKEIIHRPGQGIAKEMALLRGETDTIPPVSASDNKFPNAIRSPLKDEEWNTLTSPPRSPEARTPGYIMGEGLPALQRHLVKMPGQPRVPYPKRSPTRLNPVDEKPQPKWYVAKPAWHQSLPRSGHGPLIGPRLAKGQTGQYEPPQDDRLLMSRSLSRTMSRTLPLPNIAGYENDDLEMAPTPLTRLSSSDYIPPTLDFERKVW